MEILLLKRHLIYNNFTEISMVHVVIVIESAYPFPTVISLPINADYGIILIDIVVKSLNYGECYNC